MEVVKRRMMMRSKKMREMKNLKSVNLLLLKVEARYSLLSNLDLEHVSLEERC